MNKLATTFCLVVAWVLATPAALGFTVLTGQHLDLKVAYSDADGFSVFVEDVSRTEFALRDTLLFDGPAGTTGQPRPAGSQWDFLGVNAGETIYLWPQNFLMGRLFGDFQLWFLPGSHATVVGTTAATPGASVSRARWVDQSRGLVFDSKMHGEWRTRNPLTCFCQNPGHRENRPVIANLRESPRNMGMRSRKHQKQIISPNSIRCRHPLRYVCSGISLPNGKIGGLGDTSWR